MKLFALILLISLIPTTVLSEELSLWNLPLTVSDTNTKIQFDVDTTWHVVTGKISGTNGSIALSDPSDPRSVTADIHIPVASIDTGWKMRNDSLFDHMNVKDFPEIIIHSSKIDEGCEIEVVNKTGRCKAFLLASLTIRDVTKAIKLPIEITLKNNEFYVEGSITFPWASYNVEDPSIVMAKVQPDVTVSYDITIPASTITK